MGDGSSAKTNACLRSSIAFAFPEPSVDLVRIIGRDCVAMVSLGGAGEDSMEAGVRWGEVRNFLEELGTEVLSIEERLC